MLFVLDLVFLFFLFFQSSCLVSPRLEKRELACVFLVHLFVYFARVNFCPFLFDLNIYMYKQKDRATSSSNISYGRSLFSSSWCQGLAAVCDCGSP